MYCLLWPTPSLVEGTRWLALFATHFLCLFLPRCARSYERFNFLYLFMLENALPLSVQIPIAFRGAYFQVVVCVVCLFFEVVLSFENALFFAIDPSCARVGVYCLVEYEYEYEFGCFIRLHGVKAICFRSRKLPAMNSFIGNGSRKLDLSLGTIETSQSARATISRR